MNALHPVPKVYLAGGMKSSWQDIAIGRIAERHINPVMHLDPRRHGSRDESVYISWDLAGVEAADVVFAHLERDNPGGHGLALEIGFAVGMARAGARLKHIILVGKDGHPAARYFGMGRVCSDVVVKSLEEGIEKLLEQLARG